MSGLDRETRDGAGALARSEASAVTAALGRRAHDLRTGRGWSLRHFGGLVSVHESTLSKIENGADTTIGTAARIAAGLGVPVAGLLRPFWCLHCLDAPPRGFTCDSCGASGTAVTG